MTLLSIMFGALLGAAALTILTVLFHWILFRRALRYGQYAMVFFGTAPIGIVLDGMTGWVIACHIQGQTVAAARRAVRRILDSFVRLPWPLRVQLYGETNPPEPHECHRFLVRSPATLVRIALFHWSLAARRPVRVCNYRCEGEDGRKLSRDSRAGRCSEPVVFYRWRCKL